MPILEEPTTRTRTQETQGEQEEKALEMVAGGSSAEAIAGGGAVVLAILGLAGVFPGIVMTVAVIAAGCALLFQSAAMAASINSILSQTRPVVGAREFQGGVTAGFVGGAGGAVLGLLALLGVVPAVLAPVAVLVLGGALLLDTSTLARTNEWIVSYNAQHRQAREWTRGTVSAAAGSQVLVGLGAIALGILALVGVAPVILTMVAVLGIGGSVFLSGAAIGGRMMSLFYR